MAPSYGYGQQPATPMGAATSPGNAGATPQQVVASVREHLLGAHQVVGEITEKLGIGAELPPEPADTCGPALVGSLRELNRIASALAQRLGILNSQL
jgi:tRNA A37 threonylcarbamoyltransferase TsaD